MRGKGCGVSEQERGVSTSRCKGIVDGVRAVAMRGTDGAAANALGAAQLVHTSAAEPERGRPPRRSQRREKAPLAQSSSIRVENHPEGRAKGPAPMVPSSSIRVENHHEGRAKGPVRGGHGNGNGAASSSMRVEPATPARAQRGATRERAPKRGRGGGGQNRPVSAEVNAAAPGAVVIAGAAPVIAPAPEIDDTLDDKHRVGEYFPAIHDELGLLCLTRLPLDHIHKVSLVCKKWKEYLSSDELYKARRSLGMRETWVFLLGQNNDKRWRAFVPSVGRWLVLPPCPNDYTFESCDKESMVAGLNLLVLGQASDGYIIWKFDTVKSRWSATPRMNHDRCMFASASFGKYAYFAGGSSGRSVIKSSERYNSETNSWELLSEMNQERKACSGFVMDGKFHVIGGHVANQILSSGEAYDPDTNTWTVIENMWPHDFVPDTQVSPPLVAVLKDKLYGINIVLNELMSYDKEQNKWCSLGKVPARAENVNGWGLGFKAVGEELFVIGGPRGSGQFVPMIHAYRPRKDGTADWAVADLKIPTSGFIYNCAVMSG